MFSGLKTSGTKRWTQVLNRPNFQWMPNPFGLGHRQRSLPRHFMTELPSTLRQSIPPELEFEANRWWNELSEIDRADLRRLCDARKEAFLFETFDPNNDQQKIAGGRFLPHDDATGIGEWGDEYFDTLLSNPELMIVYDPPRRTFFIGCHRHASARNCFRIAKSMVPSTALWTQ